MGKSSKTGLIFGRNQIEIFCGSALPFGASILSQGINFSLFSKNAREIHLLLFESGVEEPVLEIPFDPDLNRTGDVWHIFIKNLPRDVRYGYRVEGPYSPKDGHYFNKTNILIDPYAKALTGGAVWDEPIVRKGVNGKSEGYLRRSFIPYEEFDWMCDRPINRPLKDTIIYELHVRGFTVDKSSDVKNPGTFEGIIEKIPYLKDLGITAVELMPINEFDEQINIFTSPDGIELKQYWGYNSIAFFAPKASYTAGAITGSQNIEFKKMVRELHKAGIEIILDVVFNHTGEGGVDSPTSSFRGLENSIYYILDENGDYKNYSGCGNTMNCNHPVVRQLIIDCLRYWVSEMHVDGFRFDLASILGRDQYGNVLKNPPVLEEIAHDPILAGTKIIAEAWDAAGLYQVGSFPAWGRWAEWNGKYRDDVRRFLLGNENIISDFATRFSGSSDLYHVSGRNPYHSINFITSHDGFTLYDLVSYNKKHNKVNGENNKDGDNNNYSYNWGKEGPVTDKKIEKKRDRQLRNYIVTLLLSQGTPMLLAGDEFKRTQAGNNNAYSQDNEISWINWQLLKKNADFFRFCKGIIAFRKKHSVLRRDYFFSGKDQTGNGISDVSWHGKKPFKPDFGEKSKILGVLIDGSESESEEIDDDIFIFFNMGKEIVSFEVPELPTGKKWYLKVNTANESPSDFIDDGHEEEVRENKLKITAHSIILLVSKK